MDPKLSQLLTKIRNGTIGSGRVAQGPFGARRLTYADYTASGRALSFIEDFVREEVLPLYANTHTETSTTSLQTTRFREDARQLIHEVCGASEKDCVIFCGSGATHAINKLIDVLNLRLPADLDARYGLQAFIPVEQRPVVFIGPYEHHSNELPWRESIADVVVIPEDENGQIDQTFLERELARYADRPTRIGSFSAASNVTGFLSAVDGISTLLHRYGAYAFWDFAAAAPYVRVDMNAQGEGIDALAYKDAVFISPHKFIGGPGTPGVLVVKRSLLRNRVPTVPGGGTVSYVRETDHEYLDDPVHREEGGTPAIIESIRAGMVFHLKREVGEENIEAIEADYTRRAIARWSQQPNLEILGNPELPRLSILSFVIHHGSRRLHHNYVVALLNDLFGIQARGGCSCAGPYGHRLLHINHETSTELREAVHRGHECMRPGWTRLNFNYFISEATFNYVLGAVAMVAARGHLLLRDYSFDADTGLWRHRERRRRAELSLRDLRYDESGELRYPLHRETADEDVLPTYLARAQEAFDGAEVRVGGASSQQVSLACEHERLRWFVLSNDSDSRCTTHEAIIPNPQRSGGA